MGLFKMEQERQSWVCIRCGKVNAPHIDQCSCLPEATQAVEEVKQESEESTFDYWHSMLEALLESERKQQEEDNKNPKPITQPFPWYPWSEPHNPWQPWKPQQPYRYDDPIRTSPTTVPYRVPYITSPTKIYIGDVLPSPNLVICNDVELPVESIASY